MEETTTLLIIDAHEDIAYNALAMGRDIDGGFGRDETPQELDTVADIAKLANALRNVGYPEEAVRQIIGGNWRCLLERTLPSA